jgi:hypothetical protein
MIRFGGPAVFSVGDWAPFRGRDGANKAVTPTGYADDISSAVTPIAERLPQRRHVHTQRPFLNRDIRPNSGGQRLFAHHLAGLFDQGMEDCARSAPQPDRFVALQQKLLRRQQSEAPKNVLHRRRGGCAHVSVGEGCGLRAYFRPGMDDTRHPLLKRLFTLHLCPIRKQDALAVCSANTRSGASASLGPGRVTGRTAATSSIICANCIRWRSRQCVCSAAVPLHQVSLAVFFEKLQIDAKGPWDVHNFAMQDRSSPISRSGQRSIRRRAQGIAPARLYGTGAKIGRELGTRFEAFVFWERWRGVDGRMNSNTSRALFRTARSDGT